MFTYLQLEARQIRARSRDGPLETRYLIFTYVPPFYRGQRYFFV